MSDRRKPIAAASVLSGLTLIGCAVFGAINANAASLGTLTVDPATGLDITVPKVHTSAGCSADSDAYNAYVTGPGAFSAGLLIADTNDVGFSKTAGFDVQLKMNMKDAAKDLSTDLTAGTYTVTVNCVNSFSLESKGTFGTDLVFALKDGVLGYTTTGGPGSTPTTTTPPSSTATTTTAPPTSTSTSTSESTVATATTPAGPAETISTTVPPQNLASTGADVGLLMLLGSVLLIFGVALWAAGRKRQREDALLAEYYR
ncbi:hypothetical protein D5S17_18705 [Pseudonocardiaceae bacterium YIM PH 21723]|nr:hypothetical protein D5S17_18705 [Pseudonocardiaceae bacterium YIM PH 21723]